METIVNSFSTLLVVSKASEDDGERTKKELSEDLIVEILARLPVKTLLRFKCVSKLWYSLIVSPNFVSLHSTHSHRKNTVSLFSLLFYSCKEKVTRKRNPKTTVSFAFGDVTERLTFWEYVEYVHIVGCFHGVVCLYLECSQKYSSWCKYSLWNPATRQLREIIGCKMDGFVKSSHDVNFLKSGGWCGSGFCFDPVTNAFKVAQVRLTVTEKGETTAQVNVFSTATSSWTEKNIVVPYRFKSGGFSFSHRCATFVNGYMHWHVAISQIDKTFEDGLRDMYILSYNMTDEVFQRIEMPFLPVFVHYHLAAYRGSLAMFVHSSYHEVDVWVFNDCGGVNMSWSKLLTCRPSIKVRLALGFFRKDNTDLVLFRKDMDHLLDDSENGLYVYDPENGETKEFWKRGSGIHTFVYSESLAPLT